MIRYRQNLPEEREGRMNVFRASTSSRVRIYDGILFLRAIVTRVAVSSVRLVLFSSGLGRCVIMLGPKWVYA